MRMQLSDSCLRMQTPGDGSGCPAGADPQTWAGLTPTERLSYQFIRVNKLLHKAKASASRMHSGLDVNTYGLLFTVMTEPARVSTIAERSHLEVSTVSRNLSQLERHDLIERIPDPADGRAQLISLTLAGRQALADVQAQRRAWFTDLLSTWDEGDIERLQELLTRFGDTVEAHRDERN